MDKKKLTKKQKLEAAKRLVDKKSGKKDNHKDPKPNLGKYTASFYKKKNPNFNGTKSNPFETSDDKASNVNPHRKGNK